MYFTQIVENENHNCDLYSPDDTKPINPFVFRDVPISDNCNNVGIECILDEDVLEQNQ